MEVIYLGEPITYILKNMVIPIKQGNTTINLMDYLPVLKSGFGTYDTIYGLLLIYMDLEEKDIEDIALFQKAFQGMKAEYINTNAGKVAVSTVYKKSKEKPLNTYEVLALYNAPIHLEQLLFYNYISNHVIDQYVVKNHLNAKILKEEELVVSLYEALPNTENTVGYIKLNNLPTNILHYFLDDPRINMYAAILLNDIEIVKKLLSFDVRRDNYEAYNLALQTNHQEIIHLLQQDIMRKNWYETEVFNESFGAYGASRDLQSHYRNVYL